MSKELSLVPGTAGNIDHDKTALIKALIVINCSRLIDDRGRFSYVADVQNAWACRRRRERFSVRNIFRRKSNDSCILRYWQGLYQLREEIVKLIDRVQQIRESLKHWQRFIIMFYSHLFTIGGREVIYPYFCKPQRIALRAKSAFTYSRSKEVRPI